MVIPTGIRHATGFYVLTLAGDQIRAMTRFGNSMLPWFGLPRSLPSRQPTPGFERPHASRR